MEIGTTINLGDDLVPPSEIRINISLSFILGEVMILPDIRQLIEQGLIPELRRLKMSEKRIGEYKNAIRYSQQLYQKLPYPYYMMHGSTQIGNMEEKGTRYSIQDLLEGKVPDISAESLNLG